MAGTLWVRQKKSTVRMVQPQRDTMRSLGLRRPGQVVEVNDNPAIRGMIAKLAFALEVLTEKPKAPYAWKGVTVTKGTGIVPKKAAAPKASAEPKKKSASKTPATKAKGKKASK